MDDQFLDSLHKSFLTQTLDLRKEKWTSLTREFTVLHSVKFSQLHLEAARENCKIETESAFINKHNKSSGIED